MKYSNISSRITRWDRYQFGLAVFSKYPIINSGRIINVNYPKDLSTTNYSTFSDIVFNKDTIRVYNVHLESFRISEGEDIFSILESGTTDKIGNESRKLLSQLKTSYIFRARQIKPIREHIDNSPYPVIICGDYNDTPASWAYAKMSEGLQDAYIKAGRGLGRTYISYKYPFRIDYILADKKFEIHKFDNPEIVFSDHYPIYAACSFKPQE